MEPTAGHHVTLCKEWRVVVLKHSYVTVINLLMLSALINDWILLWLCRSSSISGEFWWLRFKPIRTLGSARLSGPWRALHPLPPAPHPRPRPLLRKALPRPSSLALPRPCRMHTRAEEHKLKKQEAQKCSIPFPLGGNTELPGPKIAKNCGKNQAGGLNGPSAWVWGKY